MNGTNKVTQLPKLKYCSIKANKESTFVSLFFLTLTIEMWLNIYIYFTASFDNKQIARYLFI